ncbi:MAG: AraC family transcriptional regulator, partial [Stenotrophomonas sp.]
MAIVHSSAQPMPRLAPQQSAALQRALRYIDEHLSQSLRVTELAE